MQEVKQALKDYEIVLNEMIQRFLQLEKSINEDKLSNATTSNYLPQFEQLKKDLAELKQVSSKECEEKLLSITVLQQELLSRIDIINQASINKSEVKKPRFIDFYKAGIAAIFLLCFLILGLLIKFNLKEPTAYQNAATVSPEVIKYAFIKSLPQGSIRKIIATVDTLYAKDGPAIMQKETEKNLKKQKASTNL